MHEFDERARKKGFSKEKTIELWNKYINKEWKVLEKELTNT